MSGKGNLLGRLVLEDGQGLVHAKAKLRRLLRLGRVDKFEIVRIVGGVSEVAQRRLSVGDTPLELSVSLSSGAGVLDISLRNGNAEARDRDRRSLISRSVTVMAGISLVDEFGPRAMDILNEKRAGRRRKDIEAVRAAGTAQLDFMRTVSHELRTPLNVILGYSEMLLEDAGDGQARDDLERIHNAGRQLLAIVDDALKFSRAETGKVEADRASVSCRALVEEIAGDVARDIQKNGNSLIVNCSETVPDIVTDRKKLAYILNNLLTNAANFTEHGEISLNVVDEGRVDAAGIVFEVRDTGRGISEGELEALFEPFARPGASGMAGGPGMGLLLCRRYADLIGGTLSARSVAGEGTIFRLQVPLDPAA